MFDFVQLNCSIYTLVIFQIVSFVSKWPMDISFSSLEHKRSINHFFIFTNRRPSIVLLSKFELLLFWMFFHFYTIFYFIPPISWYGTEHAHWSRMKKSLFFSEKKLRSEKCHIEQKEELIPLFVWLLWLIKSVKTEVKRIFIIN